MTSVPKYHGSCMHVMKLLFYVILSRMECHRLLYCHCHTPPKYIANGAHTLSYYPKLCNSLGLTPDKGVLWEGMPFVII